MSPPPPADLPSTPASLASLRQTWRATQQKHALERDRKLVPLYQRYLEALSVYEGELTRADRLADARTVREAQERIREAMPQPDRATGDSAPAVAQGKPAPASPAVPVSGGGSWRQLATWVIGLGGSVEVAGRDGQTLRAEDVKALPSGRFEILAIYLPDGKAAQATDKDFTLLVTARSLRELVLSGAKLTTLEPIRGLPQLSSLLLSEFPVLEDAALASALRGLPSLAELRLHRCNVGQESLKALATCPKLSRLDLNECPNVDDDALASLGACAALSELRLYDMQRLNDQGISRLGERSRIRELRVDGRQFTGEGWDSFGRQAQLATLTVYTARLSAEGVGAIARIASLRQLALEGCSLTDEMLEPFAATSRLESLSLEGNPISGSGLRAFSANQSLRSLAIDGDCPITDEGLGLLVKQWPRLEVLELGPGAYSLAGFSSLADLKQLADLSIEQPQADDRWALALEKMARLKNLTLEDWKITGSGLDHLRHLKALTYLRLNGCKSVDDSALPALREFKRLSELHLNDCGLSEDGLAQLRKALPATTYLGN